MALNVIIMSMRKATIITAMLAGFTFNPASAVEPGQIAPEFALPGRSGQVVRLSDYRDKVVYLYFWTSWCGTCVQAFPWLNEMQSKYGAKGLQIIAIDLDVKAEDAINFLADTPTGFVVALDTKASSPAAYKIKALHTSLLIEAGGKVIARKVVVDDTDKSLVESSIRQALANR